MVYTGQEVWVVGQLPESDQEQWSIIGIYTGRELAERQCFTSRHFLGPMKINDFVSPTELDRPWEGCYFPHPEDDELS